MSADLLTSERRGILAALGTAFIFGLSFMFTKQAVQTASVYSLLSWRFFTACLLLLILRLTGVIRTNYRGKRLTPLLALSLIYPVTYFIAESKALEAVASMEAGLFIATLPIVTMILASLVLKERSTRLQKLAVLLSVAGVVVITVLGNEAGGESKLSGYVFLAAAVLAGSVFVILSKSLSAFTSIEKTLFMMALSTIVFVALAVREHMLAGTLAVWIALPVRNPAFLRSLIYLSVITSALAFFLQNYSIEKLGATRNASFAPLTTLISILAGALLMKEPVSPGLLIGAAMILTGVIGANRPAKKAGLNPRREGAGVPK